MPFTLENFLKLRADCMSSTNSDMKFCILTPEEIYSLFESLDGYQWWNRQAQIAFDKGPVAFAKYIESTPNFVWGVRIDVDWSVKKKLPAHMPESVYANLSRVESSHNLVWIQNNPELFADSIDKFLQQYQEDFNLSTRLDCGNIILIAERKK